MVAERSSDKNQPIKHVVMIVPVESYGITQVFGDPPESEKNSFKGDVRADATIERQREANFRRLTRR